MTPYQIELASALERCKMRPNTDAYRFVKAMVRQAMVQPEHVLTEAQVNRLEVLRLRYKRQLEKLRASKCPFDPSVYVDVPLGMFHCPECGEMVVAGIQHPDYSCNA